MLFSSQFVCQFVGEKSKMISRKYYIFLFVILCESNASLAPQAILQLVQDNNGNSSVVIEVFYNSEKVKILDETLRLQGQI